MSISTTTEKGKPTKEEFYRYVDVQMGGAYNMLDIRVCNEANISRNTHLYIIKHYSELKEEYGMPNYND